MEFFEDFYCKECGYKNKNTEDTIFFCPKCGAAEGKKVSRNTADISLNADLQTEVYKWLSKILSIDNWLVDETIKNQTATIFLLIWPIIETELFDNNLNKERIKEVAESVEGQISENDIDEIAGYFHDRYQDISLYRGLAQDRNWRVIENILEKSYWKVSKVEKLMFLIFVVYRYRNNIFHGIKSIKEWNKYSKEIELCIKFMLILGSVIKQKEKQF